ncbi:MAG: hypothetical protein E6I41_09190 [Chloroflexi bacterium]|nr:MAG: hypothetical protein E6I41_09190 [Chloroflexota bacterium]
MKRLIALVGLACVLGSETWAQPQSAPPLVGFSFSPKSSELASRDPGSDLRRLLSATQPDLVRLPIYWDVVQASPDELDFSSIDELLEVVAQHNLTAADPTRVVLAIGARNFLYPELHQPPWAGAREQPYIGDAQSAPEYRTYFVSSITRYGGSPLLYAWQVENEPLDYVGNELTGQDEIAASQLAWEIAQVHELDPAHKAVVTTYDGWNVAVDVLQLYAAPVLWRLGGPSGHPEEALQAGDALGLDLYVDGPHVPHGVTTVGLRSTWKQQAVDFWAARAHGMGKEIWLAEMQAEPWNGETSFTPRDLLDSAADYRQEPLDVVLMWGAETWLEDPTWLAGVTRAMDLLKSR